MAEKLEIPKHWKYISLVEDLNYVPTGVEPYEGEKPYYSTGSIKDKEHIPEGIYSFSDRPSRANRLVQKNDVLQARMKGTNKALLIDDRLDGALFSTGFFQVRPYGDTYVPKFLYFYLGSSIFLKEKDALCSGSTQSALNDTNAKKIKIPLAPIEEQNRIVAKIESLFSELDKSIESLQRAKKKLALYRQSVLKAAFEGELTKAWREAHKDELEDADTLLERIKKERKKAYEKRLEEWKAAVKAWEESGKEGKKPAKPKKPKELPPISEEELRELPELPDGWKWIHAGELFEFVTSGSRGWAKYYSNDGAIFIRITNLNYNSLELDLNEKKIQHVRPPIGAEGSRTKVTENDFLFSITGYLGMFAIAPKIEEAYVNQHIALARPLNGFNYKYFGHYVTSRYGGLKYLNDLQKGAVKAGLRLDDILEFPVPLSSLEEQNQIVKEIESRFSEVDTLEKAIDENLQKAEMLRQSILKQAFEGRLINNEEVDIA